MTEFRSRFEPFSLVFLGTCVAILYGVAVSELLREPAPRDAVVPIKKAGITLVVTDAAGLFEKFEQMNYSLTLVRDGTGTVPPVYLARLPKDLVALGSAAERKHLFIRSILPLILKANEDILVARRKLVDVAARMAAGYAPGRAERRWLDDLAASYGVDRGDVAALLRRIDIIPPSLAIAQAAEESGWGTSRFALEGNALYGQRTFRQGGGMVPVQRARGKRHEVKAFTGLPHSVATYMKNLNSHRGYGEFRALRAAMRAQDRTLDGFALAATLGVYSERGKAYIKTIHTIMRRNVLAEFDKARLGDFDPSAAPSA